MNGLFLIIYQESNFVASIEEIRSEIGKIRERNERVEVDKAWEISLTRRAAISAGTYAVIVAFLLAIEAPNPYLAALVPVLGFILSTLTLPFLKNWWLSDRKRNAG
jgi:hypothetical protein